MSKTDDYLKSGIVSFFYVLFLFTPLVWFRYNSELFEFPKMTFVYVLTSLILSFWLGRMVVQKKIAIKKTPFDVPLTAFIFSQIISTIASMHPHTSLFGYYTRFHGGLLSTLAYVTLFYAFVTNLNRTQTYRALSIIVSSMILASVYAAPEHFNFSFSCMVVSGSTEANCWVQDVKTRIFGTFGQPNWLAAYMVTTIPLTWALTLIQKKLFSFNTINLLIAQVIAYATLIFTKSRSGLIGFALGFFFFWSLMILYQFSQNRQTSSKKKRPERFQNTLKYALVSIGSLALVTGIFGTEFTPSFGQLVQRGIAQPQSQEIKVGTVLDSGDLSIPVINQSGTESGKIREIVWSGAVDIIKANPFFGTGVETFAYSYYNYRPLAHNLVSEWDFLYNKAHNEFLNIAANSGLIGLISYLAIILTFFGLVMYQIVRSFRGEKIDPDQIIVGLGLTAGYLSLAVSNFFGFSTVAVGMMFFVFPALYVQLSAGKSGTHRTFELPLLESPLAALGVSLFVLALGNWMVFRVGQTYAADLIYAQALARDAEQNYDAAIAKFDQALAISPNEARFHNDYADTLAKKSYDLAYNQDLVGMSAYAHRAFVQSAETLELNPVHINFYKSQAGVFIRLAPVDPTLLETAKVILEDASSLAPSDPKLAYNLALVEKDLENEDAAIELLEKTVGMKANYEAARLELANMYILKARFEEAKEQLQYILNYIAPNNTVAKEKLEEVEVLLEGV